MSQQHQNFTDTAHQLEQAHDVQLPRVLGTSRVLLAYGACPALILFILAVARIARIRSHYGRGLNDDIGAHLFLATQPYRSRSVRATLTICVHKLIGRLQHGFDPRFSRHICCQQWCANEQDSH